MSIQFAGLTGEELLPAPRNGSFVQTRLADFEDSEIGLMAVLFKQKGDHDPALQLMNYLMRRKTQAA